MVPEIHFFLHALYVPGPMALLLLFHEKKL